MKAVQRQARLEHSGGSTPDLFEPPGQTAFFESLHPGRSVCYLWILGPAYSLLGPILQRTYSLCPHLWVRGHACGLLQPLGARLILCDFQSLAMCCTLQGGGGG